MESLPSEEEDPQSFRNAFLRRLDSLMRTADQNSEKARARYKKGYDKSVVQRKPLESGDAVYLKVQEFPKGSSKKLHPQGLGPYVVHRDEGRTVVLKIRGERFRVSSDNVSLAPMTLSEENQTPTTSNTTAPSEVPPRRVTFAQEKQASTSTPKNTPEEKEYMLTRLLLMVWMKKAKCFTECVGTAMLLLRIHGSQLKPYPIIF